MMSLHNSIVLLVLACLCLSVSGFDPKYPPPSIRRGVNLGGWFVLEPWITPSLFEPFVNDTNVAVDEWTFTAILGKDAAQQQLEAHWDSWVSETELQTLFNAGITHVRIPVGYWIVSVESFEPYVDGQWPYLLRALKWCQQIGLKVLIDIHGTPGSQNGFDNSGRRGDVHWADAPNTNMLRTYYILNNLTSLVSPWSTGNGGPVEGIELVNEPLDSIPLNVVKSYYQQGYDVVRAVDPSLNLIIHDSFRLSSWNNFMSPPQYQNVFLDTHMYHVFDDYVLSLNQTQHLNLTCVDIAEQEKQASQSLWLFTGEWSLATTDCATWLNGMLKGARWDGTLDPSKPAFGPCTGDFGNDFDQFSPEYIQFLRTFAEIQMDVYENAGGAGGGTAGWYFWNFKTEQSPQWNFLLGLEKGFIPNPVTDRNQTCANRPQKAIDHLDETINTILVQ